MAASLRARLLSRDAVAADTPGGRYDIVIGRGPARARRQRPGRPADGGSRAVIVTNDVVGPAAGGARLAQDAAAAACAALGVLQLRRRRGAQGLADA
jgi:hypothetical protein